MLSICKQLFIRDTFRSSSSDSVCGVCVWCCYVDTTKTACHSLIGECQVIAASETLREQATNSTHKELSKKEFQAAHELRMGFLGDGKSGPGPIAMLLGKDGALADFETALKYDPHNSGASGFQLAAPR